MATTVSTTTTSLDDLRAALEATVRFGVRQVAVPRWEPKPASDAAGELTSTELDVAGQPWGELPPRTAYAAANTLMRGVLDNLNALTYLLHEPLPVLAPTVVARSVLEMSATAWWLMEPGIGVRRRVCRELVVSLTSARRAAQIGALLPAGPDQTVVLAQETSVTARIAMLDLPKATKGLDPSIEGEKCPDATNLVADLLRPSLDPGAPPTSVYRAFSAVTHGELYGLMHFMDEVVQPDGTTMLEWQPSPEVADSVVQLALVAFRDTWRRINTVMGWGRIEDDLWMRKLATIFSP